MTKRILNQMHSTEAIPKNTKLQIERQWFFYLSPLFDSPNINSLGQPLIASRQEQLESAKLGNKLTKSPTGLLTELQIHSSSTAPHYLQFWPASVTLAQGRLQSQITLLINYIKDCFCAS